CASRRGRKGPPGPLSRCRCHQLFDRGGSSMRLSLSRLLGLCLGSLLFSSVHAQNAILISPERCEALADEGYERCLSTGASEEDCAKRREEFLLRCLDATPQPRPDPRPAPPPDCVERCEEIARDARAECLEAGGDERTCARRAERARIDCRADCVDDGPNADCADVCARRAKAAAAECEAAGGDPRECAAAASATLEVCLRRCDTDDPPAPLPRCEDR